MTRFPWNCKDSETKRLFALDAAETEGLRFACRLLFRLSLLVLAVCGVAHSDFVCLEGEVRNVSACADVAASFRERSNSIMRDPFEAELDYTVGTHGGFCDIRKRERVGSLSDKATRVAVDIGGHLEGCLPGFFAKGIELQEQRNFDVDIKGRAAVDVCQGVVSHRDKFMQLILT